MAWRSNPEPVITSRWDRIGTPLLRFSVCTAAVLALSAVLYTVPLRNRPLSAILLFLVVVLTVSARWGFRYSVFVSFIAALAFSWLVPPVGHFAIRDLRDLYALIAFLVIGTTSSHFSDRARREALNAKRAEDAARRSEKDLRDLIESVPAMVFVALAGPSNAFVSQRWREYTGMSLTETAGVGWQGVVHPEDLERHMGKWRACSATGEPFEDEARFRRAADGEYRWFLVRAVPLRDEHGTVLKWYGVLTDIEDRKRAEQARQEFEEQWKAAFESNPTMYFIVDAPGKIVSVNAFGAQQLGYSVNELVGQPVSKLFYEPDRDAVQKHAKEGFEQPGRTMRWEARKVRKNGTMLWVRETANAVLLSNRPVLLVVCEDITDQKRAEDAARRSETELRDVVETIPVMAFSTRPDGYTEFVNRRVLEYTGLSAENIEGPGVQSTVHPDDLESHMNKWRFSMASGEPFENEVRHRSADGEYRWFLVRALPLRDESGKVLKWYGSLTDIEDRKRAEALLTGEKRILEMVAKGDALAQILDSLCRLVEEQASDVMTSILLVEGNCLRHGGAPSLPKDYTDAIDGVAIGPSVGSCGTAAFRGEQVIVENIATDPLWAEYRELALPRSLRACWSTPVFSSEGKVIATFAMYYREPRSPSPRDQEIIEQITHLAGVAIERKQTQEALQRSEAYLAESQTLTHTGSWVWDVATKEALYLSEEWYRIYGLDPAGNGRAWDQRLQRIHPEDRNKWEAALNRAISEKSHYEIEYRLLLPDGVIKYLHVVGHPIVNQLGDVVRFMGSVTDISERKLTQDALRRSEAYLTEAQRLSKIGSWAFSPFTRKAHYWSEEMFRIWGFDPQQGPPDLQTTLQRIHPEDFERMREFSEHAFDGHLTVDMVEDHRIVLPDGTVKYIHGISHPVFDEAGSVVEYIGTAVDITERKVAEGERERLHQMEADLAHTNRVSMMGELAASLAHEVKQPITAAATNARTGLRWLQRDPPDVGEARETISRIVKDVTRAADIIDRNRSMYRRNTPQRETVNFNELIREMIALSQDAASRQAISIRAEIDETLPPITADRVQMQQVLMNLMLNGIEAMKDEGGELTIGLKKTNDGQVQLSVRDSGIGLPVENAERIFDAFFSTKAQGTGMGLSISRRIVESHGGRLWATSNPDRGATFHFTVPAEIKALETTLGRTGS